MKEEKLIELLNSLDDDLVEQEVDKLLEGVEIDMKSIKEKAHKKLNNSKKVKRRKTPYIAAACIGLLSISTVYANDISEALKSFLNKTPIYSTIVDGEGYYLEESYNLDNKIKLESVMVSEGKLEIELSGLDDLEDIGIISIIPKNNNDVVYSPGGFSKGDGKYFFSFTNKTEGNYNIKPFKDFKLIIGQKSYDVSLEKAGGLGLNDKVHTSKNNIKEVNIGAKIIESGDKTDIQILTSFEDRDLKLLNFGTPNKTKITSELENLGKNGVVSNSNNVQTDKIYAFDEDNNKYELKIPKDSKGIPVTTLETDAPKGKKLTLKIPSVIASYDHSSKAINLNINIPKDGEVTLNKEVDFKNQKVIAKSIKRISPTSAQIEFDLNTMENKNINIRDFSLYSADVKKIYSEFEGDKAIVKLEFDKDIDKTKFELSSPQFEINGNWEIDLE